MGKHKQCEKCGVNVHKPKGKTGEKCPLCNGNLKIKRGD